MNVTVVDVTTRCTTPTCGVPLQYRASVRAGLCCCCRDHDGEDACVRCGCTLWVFDVDPDVCNTCGGAVARWL